MNSPLPSERTALFFGERVSRSGAFIPRMREAGRVRGFLPSAEGSVSRRIPLRLFTSPSWLQLIRTASNPRAWIGGPPRCAQRRAGADGGFYRLRSPEGTLPVVPRKYGAPPPGSRNGNFPSGSPRVQNRIFIKFRGRRALRHRPRKGGACASPAASRRLSSPAV
jgi:hypothetical protein